VELALRIVVWVVLFVGAIKLFLWARRLKSAANTKWRRRVGLLFFVLPVLLWVAEGLLPAAQIAPLRALGWVKDLLDAAIAAIVGAADGNVTGVWSWAVKPVAYAVVYGGAGLLIGWPLDRLFGPRDEDAAQPGGKGGDDLPQGDAWRG